jgi:hypothetical protein
MALHGPDGNFLAFSEHSFATCGLPSESVPEYSGFLLCILHDRCWGVLQMLHFNDTLDLSNKLYESETLKTKRKCARVVARDFVCGQVRTAFAFVPR